MLSEVEASCRKSTFAGFDYAQPDKSTFTHNQESGTKNTLRDTISVEFSLKTLTLIRPPLTLISELPISSTRQNE